MLGVHTLPLVLRNHDIQLGSQPLFRQFQPRRLTSWSNLTLIRSIIRPLEQGCGDGRLMKGADL